MRSIGHTTDAVIPSNPSNNIYWPEFGKTRFELHELSHYDLQSCRLASHGSSYGSFQPSYKERNPAVGRICRAWRLNPVSRSAYGALQGQRRVLLGLLPNGRPCHFILTPYTTAGLSRRLWEMRRRLPRREGDRRRPRGGLRQLEGLYAPGDQHGELWRGPAAGAGCDVRGGVSAGAPNRRLKRLFQKRGLRGCGKERRSPAAAFRPVAG
jgi:hypothetical protein